MEAIFLIIHVVIAVALIAIVLLQRSDQDGMGLGSGSGSNFMTGRQSANLLTRTTAILATLFIANSLLLSVMAANRSDLSLAERIKAAEKPLMPATSKTAVPADAAPKPAAPIADEPSGAPESVEPVEGKPEQGDSGDKKPSDKAKDDVTSKQKPLAPQAE